MEFRKVLVVASVLGLAAFAQGCGNDCDAAADDVAAKYEECGFTVEDGSAEDGAEVECTDELAATATCQASCITAADCAALDLSDLELAADLGECLAKC